MLFSRKTSPSQPAQGAPREPRTPEPKPPEARKAGSNGSTKSPHSQSFIDASLTILGDLHSDGDVQLDGRICGNVSCAQLIVGTDAAITGTVTAEQAIIRGSVTGAIRAPVVILQEPARVESEIVYTVLAIDNGATFEGAARRCKNPLEEAEIPSPLAELQRIVLAADASAPKGGAGNGRDASSTPSSGHPGATPEAPADGADAVARRSRPSAA